jgi:hypothetical protein
MFRKMVTLLLFTTTVPLAVFGQNAVNADLLKSWMVDMRDHAHDKWPDTRKHLEKSLPQAVQGLATHLNDFNPSAGGHVPSAAAKAKNLRAAQYTIDTKHNSFVG